MPPCSLFQHFSYLHLKLLSLMNHSTHLLDTGAESRSAMIMKLSAKRTNFAATILLGEYSGIPLSVNSSRRILHR